jgi:hypothetical protein
VHVRVIFAHIKTSNAFLECQETFIDLCAFEPSLPIVALSVGCPLAAGEVHEEQLAQGLRGIFDFDLADGMGTAGGVVGRGRMGGSGLVGSLDKGKGLLFGFYTPTLQALDLDALLTVF